MGLQKARNTRGGRNNSNFRGETIPNLDFDVLTTRQVEETQIFIHTGIERLTSSALHLRECSTS